MKYRLNNIVDASLIKKLDLEKIYEVICISNIFIYFIKGNSILNLSLDIEKARGCLVVLAILHFFYLAAKKGLDKFLIIDASLLLICARLVLICHSNVPTYMDELCDTLVLCVCVIGIDYHKVLKSASLVYIIVILLSFLCSFTGIVETCAREYSRTYGDVTTTIIRSGWGPIHENGLGMHCFIAIACFCAGFSQFSKLWRSFIAFAVAAFVWIIPNSRFNVYLLVIMGVALLIDYLLEKLSTKKSIFYIARKCIEILVLLVSAMVPFIFMAIIVNYDKVDPTLLSKLDSIASGRISLAHSGYMARGFSIWGQIYDRGAYLDSAWIRVLIMWGIPLFIFVIVSLIYLGIKAYCNDDFILIVTVLLISISGICYELISLPGSNVFLLLPFTEIVKIKEKRSCVNNQFVDKVVRSITQNATLISIFTATFLFIILRKNIVSILQTFIECKGYNDNAGVFLILVFMAASFAAILTFSACIKAIALHHKKLTSMSILLVSCAILFSMFIFEGTTIDRLDKDNAVYDEVIADQDAMSLLSSIDGIEIVPQTKPVLYKNYYGFTSMKWLPTADYARFDDITVIVDIRDNYRTFSQTGFLQTPISDYHKIYTNDSRVIEAMESGGYTFTHYSQYVKELDLNQYAKINELYQAADGSILVKASQEGIAITNKLSEDFVDIYSDESKTFDEDGNYILHIVLNVDVDKIATMNPEEVVAHLLLTANSGTFIDYRITVGEFDNGLATCDIPFTMWKTDGKRIYTQFTIDEAYTLDFSIKEISYYRTE